MPTITRLTMASLAHAGHGWHGSGWWFGPLIPLLWISLVALTVWLVGRRRRWAAPSGVDRARDVLAERYARGDLTTDEYHDRLANLS